MPLAASIEFLRGFLFVQRGVGPEEIFFVVGSEQTEHSSPVGEHQHLGTIRALPRFCWLADRIQSVDKLGTIHDQAPTKSSSPGFSKTARVCGASSLQ